MSDASEKALVTYERRFDIDELDEVTLANPVRADDGGTVPAGSTGTVVGVWAEGKAFEVEFVDPFHALATVERESILRSRRAEY